MSEISDDGDKTRPNIRIEIQNEKMEVDESEEGEIVDEDFDTATNVSLENNGNVISTNRSVFTTGINIFDENEQQKRQERAKRFALKPEEIHNFGEADVEKLYESLGITNETDSNIRFDAVHLRSTVELTAEIVLEYFAKYAPTSIEWIDEDCCNVLWLDDVTAARAIYYTSKAVRGMPAREQVSTFAKDFLEDVDDAEEEDAGRSILLKNRQVELKHDEISQSSSKIDAKNSVDISEITIPIPPGYWRLGSKALKTKCVLLRFALRTDKKPYRIETLSKYYKTLSNTKGIIDEGKKNELRGIFERNRELNGKNPWGSLARDWDHDAKFREQIPHHHPDEPPVEVRNPSLLVRLGRKTAEAAPAEDETAEEKSPSRTKTFPRMRMYADEEEEKMKRRRLLQTIKKQSDKLARDDARPRDLRSVLSVTNHAEPPEVVDSALGEDLGRKLKNRSKHMVYAVEGEPHERKENLRRTDIRAVIEQRRARSPDHRNNERQRLESRQRSRSPQRRRSASPRERRHRHYKEHTSHRTLHSDRMGARQRRRDSDDYSDDEFLDQKPRSKVAVVIKTQKKPTVASTIWSRVQKREAVSDNESDSSSDSESASEKSKSESDGSSSSESQSESESDSSSATVEERPRRVERPGFRNGGERIGRNAHLKITSSNNRYRR